MKKDQIAIKYDGEKLSALKMYLGQKNTTVEKELTKALEALYGKTVPAGVREFISLRSGTDSPTEKKKKNVAPSAVADLETTQGEGS